jgi:hypothetical protein
MIEYLPSFFLLCLVLSVVFLIRLLLEMPDSMDSKTDYLTTELKDISITLNDIADLFNDALGAINNSPIAQTPSSPMESILSGLISSVMSPKNHGNTQEPQVGPIYEFNETRQVEAHYESI